MRPKPGGVTLKWVNPVTKHRMNQRSQNITGAQEVKFVGPLPAVLPFRDYAEVHFP